MKEETLDNINNKDSMNYAGFGERLVAYLIDAAIFTFLAWLIWGKEVVNMDNGFHVQFNNEKLLVPFAYFLLSWIILSSSIGKLILGLKIVDADGKKIDFIAAIVRSLIYFILFIGCWFILGDDQKRALHDRVAKTFVVKGR